MSFHLYSSTEDSVGVYSMEGDYHAAVITKEEFVELMIKAQSKCSRSPASMQKFMDIVIHGEPQQDYSSMDVYNVSTSATDTAGGSDN